MKKFLIFLIGCVTIGAAFPAFAGPDWQVIEHGRKVKLARIKQEAAARDHARNASRGASTPTPVQQVRK